MGKRRDISIVIKQTILKFGDMTDEKGKKLADTAGVSAPVICRVLKKGGINLPKAKREDARKSLPRKISVLSFVA